MSKYNDWTIENCDVQTFGGKFPIRMNSVCQCGHLHVIWVDKEGLKRLMSALITAHAESEKDGLPYESEWSPLLERLESSINGAGEWDGDDCRSLRGVIRRMAIAVRAWGDMVRKGNKVVEQEQCLHSWMEVKGTRQVCGICGMARTIPCAHIYRVDEKVGVYGTDTCGYHSYRKCKLCGNEELGRDMR